MLVSFNTHALPYAPHTLRMSTLTLSKFFHLSHFTLAGKPSENFRKITKREKPRKSQANMWQSVCLSLCDCNVWTCRKLCDTQVLLNTDTQKLYNIVYMYLYLLLYNKQYFLPDTLLFATFLCLLLALQFHLQLRTLRKVCFI